MKKRRGCLIRIYRDGGDYNLYSASNPTRFLYAMCSPIFTKFTGFKCKPYVEDVYVRVNIARVRRVKRSY